MVSIFVSQSGSHGISSHSYHARLNAAMLVPVPRSTGTSVEDAMSVQDRSPSES